MKRNGFLLGMLGISLGFAAYAAATAVYAESNEHEDRHEAKKADSKEHEDRKAEGNQLLKGVPHAVRLSNLSNKPLEEIEIRFSGKNKGDFRQTNNCGEKLAGNASCVISVTFVPRTPGPKSAAMEVHTSGGNQVVYLSGTGA